jgi:flagellar hook-associated protein 1 FlgK
MSILSILNQGTLGLAANQLASQVSSQNITNAATEGYVRRASDTRVDGSLTGQTGARRVLDPFLEKRLLSAESSSGQASAERLALDPLDTIFAESEGGLGSALDAFLASLSELSARPGDMPIREQVLGRAGQLAMAFQNAAGGLADARTDANQRIQQGVDEVNVRIQ